MTIFLLVLRCTQVRARSRARAHSFFCAVDQGKDKTRIGAPHVHTQKYARNGGSGRCNRILRHDDQHNGFLFNFELELSADA